MGVFCILLMLMNKNMEEGLQYRNGNSFRGVEWKELDIVSNNMFK